MTAQTAQPAPDSDAAPSQPVAAPHPVLDRRPAADAISVLTQNIRQVRTDTAPGDADHWGDRAAVVADLLRAADADVVGTQEVLWPQMPVLDDALDATHLRLGIGRQGGARGEHNLLHVRRERFDVLDWDQFWLSEEPDRVGSCGWDAACERIAVWARVSDRRTGRELVVAVTHLDHQGERARREGAALLAERLLAAAAGDPVVLVGDFNAVGGDSEPWRALVRAGLADAHDAATGRVGEDIGTFPNYGASVPGEDRIDWIMTRGLDVETYGARDHVVGGVHASDHAAVAAALRPA